MALSTFRRRLFPGFRAPRAACPALVTLTVAWMATACDAGGGAEVQSLPPLSRPPAEARIGLPEIAGKWNFAGWDLPTGDSASALAGLAAPGGLRIESQRLDSLAGLYGPADGGLPFVGEVRRDGIVSLVVMTPDGPDRFIAGRLQRDTLWVELTSLSVAASWPQGARVAFVRDSVAAPFIRLADGQVIRRAAGSVPAMTGEGEQRTLPENPRPPERQPLPRVRLEPVPIPGRDTARPPAATGGHR